MTSSSFGHVNGFSKISNGRRFQTDPQVEPWQFAPTSNSGVSWSPPRSGYWKFVGWGAGGGSDGSAVGGSGAYFELTKFVRQTDVLKLIVGTRADVSADGNNTNVTFPDGKLVQATGGQGGSGSVNGSGGTATGGDVNLSGSVGPTVGRGTNGGAGPAGPGAPANFPYQGGQGGGSLINGGLTPGGGADNITNRSGGDGLLIAVFMHE